MQPSSPSPVQQFVVQHSLFGTPVTKTKDPPRYEEAIKQTRSAQPALPEVSEGTVISQSHFGSSSRELPQLELRDSSWEFYISAGCFELACEESQATWLQ